MVADLSFVVVDPKFEASGVPPEADQVSVGPLVGETDNLIILQKSNCKLLNAARLVATGCVGNVLC